MATQTATKENKTEQRSPAWKVSFWRPNKKNDGCGAHLEYRYGDVNVYLVFIPQTGPEQWNYEARLIGKLSLTEVGEMLAVANGFKEGLGETKDGKWSGLFHYPDENDKSKSTAINLTRNTEDGRMYLNISKKQNNETRRHSAVLGHGDGQVIRVFLENAINMITRSATIRPEQTQSE